MSDIIGLPGSGTGDSAWNVPPLPSSGATSSTTPSLFSSSGLQELDGIDLGTGSDNWSEGSTGNSFLDTLESLGASSSSGGPLLPSANTSAPAATTPGGTSSTSSAGADSASGIFATLEANMYNVFAVVLGLIFVVIGAGQMAKSAGVPVPVE
jgi:hypothetical protein